MVGGRPPRATCRSWCTGAKPAPYPGFIAPCDPTLRERAPEGSDWLHEIKIDGYRAQLHIHDGRVRVFSRSGYDWTEQFSQIARAAEALSARELIIVLWNGDPERAQMARDWRRVA